MYLLFKALIVNFDKLGVNQSSQYIERKFSRSPVSLEFTKTFLLKERDLLWTKKQLQ